MHTITLHDHTLVDGSAGEHCYHINDSNINSCCDQAETYLDCKCVPHVLPEPDVIIPSPGIFCMCTNYLYTTSTRIYQYTLFLYWTGFVLVPAIILCIQMETLTVAELLLHTGDTMCMPIRCCLGHAFNVLRKEYQSCVHATWTLLACFLAHKEFCMSK